MQLLDLQLNRKLTVGIESANCIELIGRKVNNEFVCFHGGKKGTHSGAFRLINGKAKENLSWYYGTS